jgi:hypothetical protein
MILSAFMVALGVGIETWQGTKADDVADNIRVLLEQDVIKAGWRQVNRDMFLKQLKDKPIGEVRILYKHEDTEAYVFALQIYSALRDARWTVDGDLRSIPSNGGDPYFANKDVPSDIRYDCSSGLTIWSRNAIDMFKANTAGRALENALGFGIDRGGSMFLPSDPALPENHFLVVVGQKLTANVQH